MISTRDTLLARLRSRPFDLLVIGGGIVGAGIARDAALRGLSVALVEQGDFAGGTSSKTSKLIHGGLRYLEHGHLRLVSESLRERATLRSIAPGLVVPRSLILPLYRGDRRGPAAVRLGLWLYDLLAAGRNIRPHRMLSASRAAALEPGLRVEGLLGAGVFADCQMDDARLCLANVLQAVRFGGVCANYVRVDRLLTSEGKIAGAAVQDALAGASFEVRASVVINATGPWSDRLRRMSDRNSRDRLAPTKGIHLVVPKAAQEALFVRHPDDGRMIFILPWQSYSLVGTTESAVAGPLEELQAAGDEADYLLAGLNRVLPGAHLDRRDVVASFAGARPLLAFGGTSTRATREHQIEVDAAGLISVLGGKFTTYRVMATQAVDLAVSRLPVKVERCLTDQVMLMEAMPPASTAHWQDVTRGVDPDLLGRLLVRHGAGAFRVLQLIAQEPVLGQPLCPHHEHTAAELVYSIQAEMAWTVTDLLARRTKIAWSSCQGLDALSTVTGLLVRYGKLPAARLAGQVEAYHAFLAQGLAFRQEPGAEPVVDSPAVAAGGADHDD